MLRDFPVLREKVQRVITQGHIDPEDFKGVSYTLYTGLDPAFLTDIPFSIIQDPEMNKLGQRGIHSKKKKEPKASEEDEEEVLLSTVLTHCLSCC